MYAKEIREFNVGISDGMSHIDAQLTAHVATNFLLREIAAQLAEISFHLSDLCYKADCFLSAQRK